MIAIKDMKMSKGCYNCQFNEKETFIYKFVYKNGKMEVFKRKEKTRGRWKGITYKEYCKETNWPIYYIPSTNDNFEISFNSKVLKELKNE